MKVEDYISRMEGTVLELAEGDAEDFHTMSAPEYGAIALRCRRLASYFDAIADYSDYLVDYPRSAHGDPAAGRVL